MSNVEAIKINSRGELKQFIQSCGVDLALAPRIDNSHYFANEEVSTYGVIGKDLFQENIDLLAAAQDINRAFLKSMRIDEKGIKEIAKLKQLTSLNLWNNSIGDAGAKEIAKLYQLTSLTISNNSIGDVGAKEIAKLKQLTSLNLWNNSIGDAGAKEIAKLKQLTSLNLSSNRIGDAGAKEITKLNQLTSLNLNNNEIGDAGAKEIAKLKQLTSLDLDRNSIGDAGAKEIAKLKQLTSLDLDNNEIGDTGAKEIAKLNQLKSLHLNSNGIGDDGAKEIAKLNQLKFLDLSDNSIGEVGGAAILTAYQASRLIILALHKNPLCDKLMNPEDFETADARSILAAWASYQTSNHDERTIILNEAKLLVVGNEEVGKTSLIKFMVDGEPIPKNGRKETQGIDQYERKSTRDWHNDCNIKLNIWDFGGQQIYHGTHRYFLTSRSLYLLVLQDRRNDDEKTIWPWLRTIDSIAGDAPIILVINKSDEGKQKLFVDEAEVKAKFPQVCSVIRTSCENSDWSRDSIAVLRRQIVETLQTSKALESIRNSIPQNWYAVKEHIRAVSSKALVMKMEDFSQICVDPDVIGDDPISTDAQVALLRQLNQLGIIVAHGLERDAPAAFKQISLLDPNWLTDAIYKILDSAKLEERGGRFSRKDLEDWLDPEIYPLEQHEFVLTMMMHKDMDLCFALPNEHDQFLAPEALPQKSIDFGLFCDGSLQFRYDYIHLQRSLIPRLIVRMHEYLKNPQDAWLSGAKFHIQDCDVLIRSDSENNEINIAVKGKKTRNALLIVREEFQKVHSIYKDLEVEERVPLPDNSEVTVGYEHLITLEENYPEDYEFLPEGAKRPYKPQELLDPIGRLQREASKQSEKTAKATTELSNGRSPMKNVLSWLGSNLVYLIATILGFCVAKFEFDLSITWALVTAACVAAFVAIGMRFFARGFMFRRIFASWFLGAIPLLSIGPISASFKSDPFSLSWGGPPSWQLIALWIVGTCVSGYLAFKEANKIT